MKNKFLFIALTIPFVIAGCQYQTIFKKPSFKSYSNEVTRDEFYTYFDEQYSAHELIGTDANINVDLVTDGYYIYSNETVVNSKSKRQLSRISSNNSSESEVKYDKDTKLASINSKSNHTFSESGHSAYTYSSSYESNVKRQIARISDGAIALYERPKQYEMLGYDTVEEYVYLCLKTTFSSTTFIYGELSIEADTKDLCKYYVDGSVFTLVYENKIDNQASNIDRTEDVVISESLKIQMDLKKEPIVSYSDIFKETRKFLADTPTNLKGEIITRNKKEYSQQQLKLKSTKIKAVDFTLYEKVDSVFW